VFSSKQLSISKIGVIKFGADRIDHRDLDPIQTCICDEVYQLQIAFAGTSIWLVGETIHVWLNGKTLQFHWTDTDAIKANINER
jgi:hypothetical protein